jgi:hypothetical protein
LLDKGCPKIFRRENAVVCMVAPDGSVVSRS